MVLLSLISCTNAVLFQLLYCLAQNNQEESAEGIYVSKILENGPADKAEGLQIHDKIIEVRQKKTQPDGLVRCKTNQGFDGFYTDCAVIWFFCCI